MIKHILSVLFLAIGINLTIGVQLSTAETGAGVEVGVATTRNVMTDMIVPPECLNMGRTICAQLAPNSTRQLMYGALCYKLQNKTPNPMFVPLRTDTEIEQFLLNVPADKVLRTPCTSS